MSSASTSVLEFLRMGGYAFYVWASYGIAAAVLAWNVVAPVIRLRHLHRDLRRRARQAARAERRGPARSSGGGGA